MATVTGGSIALNMLEANFAFTHGDSLITDADGFSFITVQTPNGRTQRLTGSYSLDADGNLLGGQITGLEEYSGGSLIYQISGFLLDHISWAQFTLTNNAPAQRNFIFGGSDTITGSALNDTLAGWSGDDSITGGRGNDTIYGGLGSNDTAVYSGNRADYQIVKGNGRITVTDTRGIDGVDILYDVEYFDFADFQGVVANRAPNLSVVAHFPTHGTQSIASAALFTATDADGDTLTYQVYDETAGNGRLRLNAVPLAERTTVTLSVADIANLDFKTSSTGNDKLWIRAYDGVTYSAWGIFEVVEVPNLAPTLSVSNKAPAKTDTFIAGADLATAADGDGDALTYRFYDGTVGNGGFTFSGNPVAAKVNFDVAAADLANFRYVTSTTGVGDTLWVQVYDGYEWTAWRSFTAAAPVNIAPTVNATNLAPAKGTAFINGADLFTITDPDDLNMVRYKFYDGTSGNGSFSAGGSPLAALTNHVVEHADLATLRYETSTTGVGDTLWIQAFDGFAWGSWKSFTVAAPQNAAPVITVNTGALSPAKGTVSVLADDFFDVTDPDDANPVRYKFYDGTTGNGGFTIGGTPQIERTNLTVEHVDLATIRYVTSATGTGDLLWVQAFDGTVWSAWQSFTVAAPANIAPVVTVANLTPGHGDAAIEGVDLFDLVDPDDANTAVAYKFYDGTMGNGAFYQGGVLQAERLNIDVTAAQLADFEFRTSASGSDVLWVQAFDGAAWSAWKSFTVAAIPNAAPVVTVQNLTPALNQTEIDGQDLFDVSDADLDAITHYKFYDGTAGNGRFWLSGSAAAERLNIEIAAAALPDFEYRTSTSGGDTLWVQAFDGYSWSTWKSFNVAPAPASFTGFTWSGSVTTMVWAPLEPGVFSLEEPLPNPAIQSVNTMTSQIAAAETLTSGAASVDAGATAPLWNDPKPNAVLLASG